MGRQQGVLPPHVIIMQLVCHQQGVLRKGVILPHTKKCRTRWPVGSAPDIFQPGHTRLPQQNGNLKAQAETPFPYLHALPPLFRPLFCVLPQRPCVHYTELLYEFVGRSLTKPAQIVDIFLSAWDFSCVFISGRPKTGIYSAAVPPLSSGALAPRNPGSIWPGWTSA